MLTPLLTQIYSLTSQQTSTDTPLVDILGRATRTLLYVYPRDNTPGCTLEGQDFTRLQEAFTNKGIQVIGISRDDGASHERFINGCSLKVDLITDHDGSLHEALGAMGNKMLYGKTIFGVIRSSFLVNAGGEILQAWRNVKATGHAEKVLREINP